MCLPLRPTRRLRGSSPSCTYFRNVAAESSTSTGFHSPAFIEAWACGIFLASAISMEKVSSAVEMVLPLGVFITTMPR